MRPSWIDDFMPWSRTQSGIRVGLFDVRFHLGRNLRDQGFLNGRADPHLAQTLLAQIDLAIGRALVPESPARLGLGLEPTAKQALQSEGWYDTASEPWIPYCALYRAGSTVVRSVMGDHLGLTLCLGALEEPVANLEMAFASLLDQAAALEEALVANGSGYAWSPAFGYLAADLSRSGNLASADWIAALPEPGSWLSEWQTAATRNRLILEAKPWGLEGIGLYRIGLRPQIGLAEADCAASFAAMAQFCIHYLHRQAKEALDSDLADKAYRAVGICRYARRLDFAEYKESLSLIFRAWSCDILKGVLRDIPLRLARPGMFGQRTDELASHLRQALGLYLLDSPVLEDTDVQGSDPKSAEDTHHSRPG